MSLDATFPCDSEFVKLLGRRSDVDLTLIALELTRDAYPHLEFRPTLDWIAWGSWGAVWPLIMAFAAIWPHTSGRTAAFCRR